MNDPEAILAAARAAVLPAAVRTADLLRTGGSLAVPIPDSQWSVADAAAHVVIAHRMFAELVEGAPFPMEDMDPESVGAFSARAIDEFDEADPAVLAAQVIESAERFVDLSGKLAATDTVDFHHHRPLPVWALVAISLGEHVLHGYDMAAGLNLPWRLDPNAAALVLAGYGPLMPGMVDPAATAGLSAVLDIRLHGGAVLRAAFNDGALSLGAPDDVPPDATLSTDAATLLLAATGRLRLHAGIALGLAEATGPDPALAARFPDLFVHL